VAAVGEWLPDDAAAPRYAAGRRATVREVLSYGALDAGKTEGATGRTRRPPIDALLGDDIAGAPG